MPLIQQIKPAPVINAAAAAAAHKAHSNDDGNADVVVGTSADNRLIEINGTDDIVVVVADTADAVQNNNHAKVKTKHSAKSASTKKPLNKKQKDKCNSVHQKPAADAAKTADAGDDDVTERIADIEATANDQPLVRSTGEGNYDILPLIRIEEPQTTEAAIVRRPDDTTETLRSRSGFSSFGKQPPPLHARIADAADDDDDDDGIPFIDAESPRRIINYHEQRFITIEPCNVGSAAAATQQRHQQQHHQQHNDRVDRRTAAAMLQVAVPKKTTTTTTASTTPPPAHQYLSETPDAASAPAASHIEHNNNTVYLPHQYYTHHHAKQQQLQQQHQQHPPLIPLWAKADSTAVAHHFQVFGAHERRLPTSPKLCQVCHEFLTTGGGGGGDGHANGDDAAAAATRREEAAETVVRCLTCAFVCHESCVQVSEKSYTILCIYSTLTL